MRPISTLPTDVQIAYHAAMMHRLYLCATDDGAGLCDEVAATTWRVLKERGIPAKIVYGDYLGAGDHPGINTAHFWVEVEGFIVDGTARQFGRRELVLVVEARRSRCYVSKDTLETEGSDEIDLRRFCPDLMTDEGVGKHRSESR